MSKSEHTMKALPTEQQPYEKARIYGTHSLSDVELLAIVLRNGTAGHSALETAQALLTQLGSLSNLCSHRMHHIRSIPGIGKVKQLQLMAIAELSMRLWQTSRPSGMVISDSAKVYEVFKERLRHEKQEHVHLLLLDSRCRLTHTTELTKGTINSSLISPRDVFCEALNYNAAGIILVHNHPSGDPTPSKDDILITNSIHELGTIMQLPLMDHVIIGDNTYVSMKEQGHIMS